MAVMGWRMKYFNNMKIKKWFFLSCLSLQIQRFKEK